MNENEMVVVDEELETTENVEQTTEETDEQVVEEQVEEKLYTQAELEEKIRSNVARSEARLHKKHERELKDYKEMEEVLKAGLEQQELKTKELTQSFRDYYTSKGKKMPEKSAYSKADMDVLVKNDADSIIESGINDVVDEINRLADMGPNLNERDKAVLNRLVQYQSKYEKMKQLEKIGVSKDVYDSKDFKEFASQFNDNVPMDKIYGMYSKTTDTRPPAEKIGSMKNTSPQDEKDIFTPEEVDKLTPKDYDDPKTFAKIRRSMLSWKE